jgi:dipeptidyl aminopeptidase/acylaminoacyl peptidase
MSTQSGRATRLRALSPATYPSSVPFFVRRHVSRVNARHLGLRLGMLLSALLVVGALSASGDQRGTANGEAPQRPYRLDDKFDSEEFDAVTFSPDGQAVAFTRRRAVSSQALNGFEINEALDDIWVQAAPGLEAKNISKGAADASGAWEPRWSRNGDYLSFLSSRGGNVTVWVWERRSNSVRQVSRTGIEFRGTSAGCLWLADSRLLCLAVPEGERSTPSRHAGKAAEFASAMWEKVRRGELAVSAADSLAFRPPSRRLLLLDLGGGARDVATVPFEPSRETWRLSPDESMVAFVRDEVFDLQSRYRGRMGYPASLDLRRLDAGAVKLAGNIPANVLMQTLEWSPDSRALAFFALGNAKANPALLYGEELLREVQHEPVASLEQPAKFWQIDMRQGTVAEIDTGDIDLGRELLPPSFEWLATGDWLFRARRLSDRAAPHRQARTEWLVLGRDARVRNLLRDSSASLEKLKTFDGGRTFFSLYQQDVWVLDAAAGTTRNLTQTFAPPVLRYEMSGPAGEANLMLKAGAPVDELGKYWARYKIENLTKGVDDYVLDPRTGTISRISAPEPDSSVAAFHGPTRSSVYAIDDNKGTRLWRGTGLKTGTDWVRLAEANTQYKRVATYQERLLEYTTQDGQVMKAKVTLPLDYVEGRKYPMVVDSDIGYSPASSRHLFTLRAGLSPTDHQTAKIFASAGYVYMFTSAPTLDILDDAGRGNLLLLTHGILPAVDAAIAAGFADPDRLVLYGFSSFGFGALGVVTQTSRFKAAVAESLWSDQMTQALTLDATVRYSDNPFDYVSQRAMYSSFTLPFWRNGDHLRRNSPLNYVDRVRTPLLIIQHEFDFLPMSQAEMFFSSLVFQRKPARFLRYFGEEHVLRVPANVRDRYREIFAWYDEHSDIERDQAGRIVFDGARAKSRHGQPALTPRDFTRFGPAAEGAAQQTAQPNN